MEIEFGSGTVVAGADVQLVGQTNTFAPGADIAYVVELPAPTDAGSLRVAVADAQTGEVLATHESVTTPGASVYYATAEDWISDPGEYELLYYVNEVLVAEGAFTVEQPAATPRPTPEPTTDTSDECHSSYPGVCIPPAPPDLDCDDVRFDDFRVRGQDPHNFDGDGDGIGCESGGGNGGNGGPNPTQKPRNDNEGSCDSSYPTLCIPPNSPDLDCGDVRQKNFPVRGRDPHGFDGDNDGFGCES